MLTNNMLFRNSGYKCIGLRVQELHECLWKSQSQSIPMVKVRMMYHASGIDGKLIIECF